MSPSIVTIDPADDAVSSSNEQRTLLLAPPSLASHPTALTSIVSQYDRSVTDLQMLDRLSAGLVNLPTLTYDLALVLTDASSSLDEALPLLNRAVLGPVAESLKPKGRLQALDGSNLESTTLAKEAVLAGLVTGSSGYEKPDYGEDDGTVTLKLGKKNKSDAGPAVGSATVNLNGGAAKVDLKRPAPQPAPAGVGFVDFSDDLDVEDDDELIDEDTLMTEEDLKRPINIRTYPSVSHITSYVSQTNKLMNSRRMPAKARQTPPSL